MSLPVNSNKISYTVSSPTTEFSFPFKYWDQSDLVVNVLDLSSGAITVLTITTDYTIAPTNGDPAQGALITTNASYANHTITIERIIPVESDADFKTGDGIPPEALNSEFDKSAARLQQNDDTASRAITAPTTDADGINYELGSAEDRVGKVLSFDSNGGVITTTPAGDAGIIDTENIASEAVTGDKIAPILANGTTDARKLEDRFADVYDVKEFGVVGDGAIDDTVNVQAAIDAAGADGKTLYFQKGTYLISDTLYVTDAYSHLLLDSEATLKLADGRAVDQHLMIIQAEYVTIEGGIWDGNQANQSSNFTSGVILDGISNHFTARYCHFKDWEKRGIETSNQAAASVVGLKVDHPNIHNCTFSGNAICIILFAPMEGNAVGAKIHDNTFLQNGRASSEVDMLCGLRGNDEQGSWADSSISNNVLIMDDITDNQPSNEIQAIEVSGGDTRNVAITGNVCSGGDIGISVVSSGAAVTTGPFNCVIDGNTIYGCTQMGVEIQGNNNLISNNTMDGLNLTYTNRDTRGITETSKVNDPSYNKIVGNYVRNYPDVGILIDSKSVSCEVSNNTTVNSLYAIRCFAGTVSEMTRSAIINNNNLVADTFSGNTSGRAIYIVGGTAFQVVGNTICDYYVGINIFASIDQDYTDFFFTNNYIKGSANEFAVGGAYSARVLSPLPVKNNIGIDRDYIDYVGDVSEIWDTGDPEASVTANVGSVYHRTDGGASTSLYIKETGTGNTGWVGK